MSDAETTPHSDLGAILELQQMIAEELQDSSTEFQFSRSFMPLTNGLGLDSPKKKEAPLKKTVMTALEETADSLALGKELEPANVWESSRRRLDEMDLGARPKKVERPRIEVEAVVAEPNREPDLDQEPFVAPPPVPRPAIWRRACAAILDEVFVWGCFAIITLITVNVLANSKNYFALESLATVHQPTLFRYALLEFGTLWLSYFALGIGILDMTFGMWVWGIRVGYGEDGREPDSKFLKKFVRVVLSFFFFAPVLPLFLLIFRVRGKNLVDALSGTNLYRLMV